MATLATSAMRMGGLGVGGGPMYRRRMDGGRGRRGTPGHLNRPRGVGLGDDDSGNDGTTLEGLYNSSLGVVTRLLDPERPSDQDQVRVLSDDLSDWTSTVRPALIRLTLSDLGGGHNSDSSSSETREGMMYSVRFMEALCTFARRDDDVDGDDWSEFDLTGVMGALESTLVDLGYLPSPADEEVDGEGEARGGVRQHRRRAGALDTFLGARGGGDDGRADLEAWYWETMSLPRTDGDDNVAAAGGRRSKRAKLSPNRHQRREYDEMEDGEEEREKTERMMIRLGAMLSLPLVLAHGHHRRGDDGDDVGSSSIPSGSRKRKAPDNAPSRPVPSGAGSRAGGRREIRRRDDRNKWRSELLYILSRFVSIYYYDEQKSSPSPSYRDVVVPSTRTFRDLLGFSASDCDVALACFSLDSLNPATAKDDARDVSGIGCGGITPGVALQEVLRPGVVSVLSSYVRLPRGGDVDEEGRRRNGRRVALCTVARCLLAAGGASAGRCAMELWRGCGMDASSLLSRRRGMEEGASSSRPPPSRRRLHRSLAAAAAPTSDRDDETTWLVVRTELSILLSARRTEEACLLANLASRVDTGDGGGAVTATKLTPAADVGRESWGRIFEAVSSAAAATTANARRDDNGDGRDGEVAALASLQDMLHVFPIGPVGQRLLLERLNADMDVAERGGKLRLVGNIQKLMYCFLVARTDPISAFSSALDIDWWKLSLAATDAAFDVTGESLAFLLNDVGDGATLAAAARPVTDEGTPVREAGEDWTTSAPAGGVAPSSGVADGDVRVATSEETSAMDREVHSKTMSDEAPHALTKREVDAAKGGRAVTPIDPVAKKKIATTAALEVHQPMGALQAKHLTGGEHAGIASQPQQARSTKIDDSVKRSRLREARRQEPDVSGDIMSTDYHVGHGDALEATAKRESDTVKERSEDEPSENLASVQKNRGEHPKRREGTPRRNIEVQAGVETAPEDISKGDNRSAAENLYLGGEEAKVEVLVMEENEEEEDVEVEVQVAEEDLDEEEVDVEVKEDTGSEEEEEEKEYIDDVSRGEDSGTEDGSGASSLRDEGDYLEKSVSSDGSQPSGVESERHLSDEEDDDHESVVVIDDDEDAEEPSKDSMDEGEDDEAVSVGVSDASVASASAESTPAGDTSPRSHDECSEAEDDEIIDEEAVEEERDSSGTNAQQPRAVAVEHVGSEQHRLGGFGRVAAGKTKQEAAVAGAELEQGLIRMEEEQVAAVKVDAEHVVNLKSEDDGGHIYVEGERDEEERLEMLRAETMERERAAAEYARLEQQRRDEEERRLKEDAEQRKRAAAEQARLEEERRNEEERAAAEKAEGERLAKMKLEEEKRMLAEQERLEQEEKERRARLRAEAMERERAAAEHARLEQQRREEEDRIARLKQEEELRERAAAEQARLEEERRNEEERAAAEKAEKERLAELKKEEQERIALALAKAEQFKKQAEGIALARAKAEEFKKQAEASRLESATKKRKAVDHGKETESDDRKIAAHRKPEGKRLYDETDGSKGGHTLTDPDVGTVAKASSPLEVLSPKSTRMSGPSQQSAGSSLRSTPGIIGTSITFDNMAPERLSLGTTTSMSVGAPPVASTDEERGTVMKPRDTATKKPDESAEEDTSVALSRSTLNAMKVAELRQECEKRGLDTTGHKEDLIHRLEGIPTAQSVSSFSSMKYEDLRRECGRLGLTMKGRKADLIERLEANLSDVPNKDPEKNLQEDSPVAETVSSFSSMRYVDLRKECHRLGLPSSGLKADLVARLENASSVDHKADTSMKLPEDSSVAESVSTFSSKKVVELRKDCKRLGLDSTGKKSDLVARLEANAVARMDDPQETPQEDNPVAESLSSFSSMNYEDIRSECRRLGLDTTGRKADLVARIRASSSVARKIDEKDALQEDSSVAESVASFSTIKSIKVSELRGLCTRRGLDSKGRKSDLVERLQQYSLAAQSPLDYESMTLADLQEEFKYVGLDDNNAFSAKNVPKADLVASLEDHIAKQPTTQKGHPKGASKPPMPPSSRHLDKKRRVQTSASSAAAAKRLRSSSDADSTGNQGQRDQSAKPPLPPSSSGKVKTSKSVKPRGTPSSAGTARTTRSSGRSMRSKTSKGM